MKDVVAVDIETSREGILLDLGAARHRGDTLHTKSVDELYRYIKPTDYLCGHNIVAHDFKYLREHFELSEQNAAMDNQGNGEQDAVSLNPMSDLLISGSYNQTDKVQNLANFNTMTDVPYPDSLGSKGVRRDAAVADQKIPEAPMSNSANSTLRPGFRLPALTNGTASTTSDTDHRLVGQKTVSQTGAQAGNHRFPELSAPDDEAKHAEPQTAYRDSYRKKQTGITPWDSRLIDTLLLSALLFPRHPYHHLLKDDKIVSEEQNNPVNDALKSQDLLEDELRAFFALSKSMQRIFRSLLSGQPGFEGFFTYAASITQEPQKDLAGSAIRSAGIFSTELIALIRQEFSGDFCDNVELKRYIDERPVELAYCLSLIVCDDDCSIPPRWMSRQYPFTESLMKTLRGVPCAAGCPYCRTQLDALQALKRFFGYDSFRSYDGKPLQLQAVESAIQGESLLAIFPTGGGKSLAFQIPALLAGRSTRTLTVVISPLVSLMKDQVDNLEAMSINKAVTINGLLDPLERKHAMERVESGEACLLYIAPETLRSPSIRHLLEHRVVERFVIDEAHCFSAWGQDFRVDYLYLARFIRQLEETSGKTIPVSCFTATAKQDVIADIKEYFRRELNATLRLISSTAGRKNLHYSVRLCKDDAEKYQVMRELLTGAPDIPTIIYASRTKKTEDLATRLTEDGFPALWYHGRMERADKSAHQDSFINGQVCVMVATSAFGMGVDKKDVGRIIHYDVSDSLESYVQEAGRAGRDERIEAECYVLFNEEDLDKHLLLLNQSKIQMKEIRQAWKAIKRATRFRETVATSARELARDAGWDDALVAVSTRVTTAIAALENAGYVRRDQNAPLVFASSISVRSMSEARRLIDGSANLQAFEPDAGRVIQYLISRHHSSGVEDAQIEVISDSLGIEKRRLVDVITMLKQEGLLADAQDLIFHVNENKSLGQRRKCADEFLDLERFILSELRKGNSSIISLKELNKEAGNAGLVNCTIKRIRTILNFWETMHLVALERSGYDRSSFKISFVVDYGDIALNHVKRRRAARSIFQHLINQCEEHKDVKSVATSTLELTCFCNNNFQTAAFFEEGLKTQEIRDVEVHDIENALLFLNRIDALRIEGGFLVLYNQLRITRLEDMKTRYTTEDYKQLDDYYSQRIQMIHIVGEYVKKVAEDYESALRFVDDYFRMEYPQFLAKYFAGKERLCQIKQNLTPGKFKRIFGMLSPQQLKIIHEQKAKAIVVAAGPGSGKTKVLVHKLASLLIMEEVKHEQLLMLTFSRAAATEFKSRLHDLIGNAASFVEIKTFHSYAFDLLGMPGSIKDSDIIVKKAREAIERLEVENNRIAKSVLVIDEAQDMNEEEFLLVEALMRKNEDLRVIAVGDDDQNIYEFRGSSSQHFASMSCWKDATIVELVENYRSKANLVALHNSFLATMPKRMKKGQLEAINNDNGRITIVKHVKGCTLGAILNEVSELHLQGTTCLAVFRNEDMIRLRTALKNRGVNTRLIQGSELQTIEIENGKVKWVSKSFSLRDLRELHSFIAHLNLEKNESWIDEDTWNEARRLLRIESRRSADLPLVEELLNSFESANKRRKYLSDLQLFIAESSYEDFVNTERAGLYLSTMHKTKGREFDNMIMVLQHCRADASEEEKRLIYVTMTRAKENLVIHFDGSSFLERFGADLSGSIAELEYRRDSGIYPDINRITLDLCHSDVRLSDFSKNQQRILTLKAGDALHVYHDLHGCKDNSGHYVMSFSRSFSLALKQLAKQGYYIAQCRINHILYWHEEDSPDNEFLVVLPQLELVGKSSVT